MLELELEWVGKVCQQFKRKKYLPGTEHNTGKYWSCDYVSIFLLAIETSPEYRLASGLPLASGMQWFVSVPSPVLVRLCTLSSLSQTPVTTLWTSPSSLFEGWTTTWKRAILNQPAPASLPTDHTHHQVQPRGRLTSSRSLDFLLVNHGLISNNQWWLC